MSEPARPRLAAPVGVELCRAGTAYWPLLLAVAAAWPVWPYLFRDFTAPGGNAAGGWVLALALAWSARLYRERDPSARTGNGWAVPVALLVYALAFGAAPPRLRALLALAALGLAVVSLPDLGLRRCSGLLALFLLVAPSAESLNFFVGAPLRQASAGIAAHWLAPFGHAVRSEGPALWVDGHVFSVDAPCSGVNGLWTGLVVAAALAVSRRLTPVATALLLLSSVVLCVPANAWRATALVFLDLNTGERGVPGWAHAGTGLVVFAAVLAALAGLSTLLGRIPEPRVPIAGRTGLSAWTTLLAATVAAAAPLASPVPSRAAGAVPFPGWPETWCGAPLRRLPETELDRRWAGRTAGPVARFNLPGGGELLLRWLDRPTPRGLHPAEDCYRGQGYRVTPIDPVHAPAPHAAGPVLWRRFRAERTGEGPRTVRAVIVSESGTTYPDPSWWWWKVAGPGSRDPGPWWMAAIQEPAP